MRRYPIWVAAACLSLVLGASSRALPTVSDSSGADPKIVEAPDPATPLLVGTGLVALSIFTRSLRKKRKRDTETNL